MKVKDLIKALKKQDADSEVILSKDAEGNGFSPLAESSTGFYEAETPYRGELHEKDIKGSVPCVVLWPVN